MQGFYWRSSESIYIYYYAFSLYALFALALNLLIYSSQFILLSSVIPNNWVLFLDDTILFLSVIYIGSSFLFLSLSKYHAYCFVG